MSKKRKMDFGMKLFTAVALLMTIVPIIVLAYLCISNHFAICQVYKSGEFVNVACKEITSTWQIMNNYKGGLLASVYGLFFLMPAVLFSTDNSPRETGSEKLKACNNEIKACIIVIILYIIAWVMAVYVTSSFWVSLGMLFMHHFFTVASIGILISNLKLKKTTYKYYTSYSMAQKVAKEKEKLNMR